MAHVFEFSFGTVSAFVTFAFCLDNRALAEDEVLCIMYGDHRDCPNCNVRHKSKAALKHRARSLSGDGRGPYNSFGDVGAAGSSRSPLVLRFTMSCGRSVIIARRHGVAVGMYRRKNHEGLFASVLPDAS